jgi:hypothetical protein
VLGDGRRKDLSAGGGQWRIGYTYCVTSQPTTSAIYCRRCGYNLRGLSGCRCTECGRAFDPANRRTYSGHPHAPLRRRLATYAVAALLAAVLLAGAGGFCLWRPWHRDAAAFRMVHLCGGTMQTTTVGPQWLRNLLGKRGAFLLERAGPVCDLSHSLVTDSDLPALNGLPELQKLRLVQTAVTDVGLERLNDLEGLQILNLGLTRVTDAGLPHLNRFKKLRELDLSETKITDAGLADLKGLKGLEVLVLYRTSAGDAGLASLSGIEELKYLDLGRSNVTDAGLESLRHANKLEILILWDTSVTDAGVAALRKALPKCQVFEPDR